MKRTETDYPAGFLWGTATSAYQIEGAYDADGKGLSIWDSYSHTAGKIHNGETGDTACDFYHRYADDIALMSELGYSALRISIAWTRIFPRGRGAVNRKGIEYYRSVLQCLRDHGIAAVVTLFHWDLPQALEDIGGWRNRETVDAFVSYAETCFDSFGDLVDYWITFNEPSVITYSGHYAGEMAPGLSDLDATVRTIHHVNLSHGLAVKEFRARKSASQIGMAIDRTLAEAFDATNPRDCAAKRIADELNYYVFTDPSMVGDYPASFYRLIDDNGIDMAIPRDDLEAIYGRPDFLGLNYYTRMLITADHDSPLRYREVEGPLEKTGMNWELYPAGLTVALDDIRKRYDNPPVLITENGRSVEDVEVDGVVSDPERVSFLEAHIEACRTSIAAGTNLIGYLHWSFMDNFEWLFGFSRRFGLVYVDFDTGKRIPKESAYAYSRIIAENSNDTVEEERS